MKITIHQEEKADYTTVEQLIEEAFKNEEQSNHTEHNLVAQLRKSNNFVPQLSLVAKYNGELVGHILLTQITIENKESTVQSLALAPVSVKSAYQNKGIGGRLIIEAHSIAKQMGYKSVVVLGHKDYYPRFGYKPCKDYGIKLPFGVPDEYCMIVELQPSALKGVNGTVNYPSQFFE